MWWIWIVVALIAAIVEIVGSGLVFIGIAAAAIAAAIAGAVLPSAYLAQSVVFAGTAIIYLIGLRPPVLRLMSGMHHGLLASPRGGSHIVGSRATVTQTVTGDGGQVRIGQGEFWSARAYNDADVLPEGSRVEVLQLEGLTALVAAVP